MLWLAVSSEYLFKGVEGNLQVALCLLLGDLGGPVNVLEDKLDGLVAPALDHVALLVLDEPGGGRAAGVQLQL